MCEQAYPAKTRVTKIFAGWAHTDCVFPPASRRDGGPAAAFEENRQAVLSGETFRGRAPSTWRRGSSPSSSRGRR
ncbi:hypothetical protein AB0K43_31165 [Kitasatospora sp. NPDC049258]|uniref:hypothetical protein n=1 Tax=Kitasatospora sp. NPDC049258 TaxID=3155394 RepID=UPI003420295B